MAAAKVASLEAEVAKLKRAWKIKCARAGERVFRENDLYKQQLNSAYNRG